MSMDQQRGDRLFETVERMVRRLGFEGLEMHAGWGRESLTRFANNAIHQNVAEQGQTLSVRLMKDQKTGRASTNRLDEAGLERVVEEAAAITRAAAADPELLPLAEPEEVPELNRYADATALAAPADRSRLVAEAIGIVRGAGQTAAGICSTEETFGGVWNSRGVRASHGETMSVFSITAMGADSSGWAKASSVNLAEIDAAALAASASRKAVMSARPRRLDAEKLTVILEPAAVLDLVGQLAADFSGTAVADKRSALTGRVAEQVFGPAIQLWDDVAHPLQAGSPFDGEGLRRRKLHLIDRGVPREIAYGRAAAAKAGVAATGHGFAVPNELGEAPANLVMGGGDSSLEQMIATCRRGVLVTRVWYIREVDPYEKIVTGMTRDGTFLIENGELVAGIRNFRFNQSLIEMLNGVELMGRPVRASGEEAMDMVVPPMRVSEFGFTETTEF